jgi:hypothetical protein
MSPTLFFADARGLPFVKEENGAYAWKNAGAYTYTPNLPDAEYERSIRDQLVIEDQSHQVKALSIPKLHDFMAKDDALAHVRIQEGNGSPIKPNYGIDANRDYHRVLKSTVECENYIKDLGSGANITVIMMHGHESGARGNNYRTYSYNEKQISDQGTVLGPYNVNKTGNKEFGSIEEDMPVNGERPSVKRCVDFMTVALFGYKYRDGEPAADMENYIQRNYFYLATTDVSKDLGDWTRKLYGESGILCFDIELSDSYRDGTRGKKKTHETDGRDMIYKPEKVVNRRGSEYDFPFFKEGVDKGKFASITLRDDNQLRLIDEATENEIPRSSTISFYEFLEIYFQQRGIFKFPGERQR